MFRELAEANGVTRWRRSPALNTDRRFIDELASIVQDALVEPSLSVSAACIQNNCVVELEPLDYRLGGLGVTERAETLNGRVAMVAIALSFLFELLSGRSLSHFFIG